MLILQGVLRAATTLGGGTNKKTGEVVPERSVLQIETMDNRGLVQMDTITVPSLAPFAEKVGSQVNLPVRAWVNGQKVGFVYEQPAQQAAAGAAR